ncbi:39S ribosomal protein L22, mitochondrial-like [Scleropages formosus]|uniref:Large ribosomal subunit protein uL22m n=1 Tax=Scleropages formosus TaxID=113540 RepID=A0A0P7WTZ0_SCLFO|nr:39S ribosomal protein L22, mitochondrial-like [Scleropages formosus]
MAAPCVTAAGYSLFRSFARLLHSRFLASASHFQQQQQQSGLHTTEALDAKNWERKNRIVYPPQLQGEPRRPAIRGMSIDQALAQLEFSDKKGAKVIKEVLLEAQDMAIKNHNVEYKSNLYVAESFSGKGMYLKRIRYHGRGRFGIMDKVRCHYFVKLVEGQPPKVEQKTSFDQAKEYVEQLKNRTIIHSL